MSMVCFGFYGLIQTLLLYLLCIGPFFLFNSVRNSSFLISQSIREKLIFLCFFLHIVVLAKIMHSLWTIAENRVIIIRKCADIRCMTFCNVPLEFCFFIISRNRCQILVCYWPSNAYMKSDRTISEDTGINCRICMNRDDLRHNCR